MSESSTPARNAPSAMDNPTLSIRKAAERFITGGKVVEVNPDRSEVTLEVFIKNESGDVVAPGQATAVLDS